MWLVDIFTLMKQQISKGDVSMSKINYNTLQYCVKEKQKINVSSLCFQGHQPNWDKTYRGDFFNSN